MSLRGGVSARSVAYGLPFLVVLAQAAFIGAGYREPYPALMMPDFSGTRTSPDGSIHVDAIEILAHFEGGQVGHLPLEKLMAPMPWFTMMPASRVGLRTLDHPSDEMVRWLRERVVALYPERRATGLDVRWYRDTYRVEEGELRCVAHEPDSASHVDLWR
jgi:hypothetical protein